MADDVTVEADYLTNEWVYTCAAHGPAPYVWRVAKPSKPDAVAHHIAKFDELGVYDVLSQCFHPDDPWLEYGIVEDRFRRRNPELYAKLVGEYSHAARMKKHGGPDDDDNSMKISNRLSQALGVLEKEGSIERKVGPATGFWSYNGQVTHLAPRPAPPKAELLTWAQYATDNGLDPDAWVLPTESS